MPRPTVWTRLVALFLLWSGLRSVWFLLLAYTNPSFRLAREIGFGPVCLTPLLILWWRREEFPDSE